MPAAMLRITASLECDCTRENCSSDNDLLYELVALNNQSDLGLGITLQNNYTEDCIWWNREGTQVNLII